MPSASAGSVRRDIQLLRALTDSAPVAIYHADRAGHLTYANPQYRAMFGLSPGQSLDDWAQAVHPNDRPRIEAVWADFFRGGSDSVRFEYRTQFRDGGIRHLSEHVVAVTSEGVSGFVGTITDVSELRSIQTALDEKNAEIRFLNRVYAALSETSQLIVRCQSESELLSGVCRIVVERGEFKLAWIGVADASTGLIRPVAVSGDEISNYLDGLVVSSSADSEAGQGPTGTALREGRPVFIQDFKTDPRVAYWRDQRQKASWGSSGAMPIRRGGDAYAVLSFYDTEPHAISGRVANLLAEMAAEIEHALERLELQAEARRAEEELRIAAIAFESRDAILVTDAHGTILRVNRAFTRTTGYAPEDVLGKDPLMLRSGHHLPEFFEKMRKELDENDHWQGEVWDRRKGGEIYPTWLRKSSVRDSNGVTTHFVDSFSDISEFKKTADTIAKLAYYDSLTGLPNRALMKDRLAQALAISGRSGSLGALLFIDLDNFKRVNDVFGHKEGDRMLQEAARRLQSALRERDTVARLGGDEFVVLLQDLGGQREHAAVHAKAIADKLLAVLSEPYEIANGDMESSASIGVTLWRGSLKADLDDLLKRADLAMYEAKKAGRNAVCFFDPLMQKAIEQRVGLEARLRLAISRDEFRLHFQKRVNENRMPVGAEALLRWQEPGHGLVPPCEFIPLAEESGLIIPIGRWVIEAACRRLKQWEQSGATRRLSLSVNVSPRQFAHSSFVRDVASIISGARIDPTLLELEITESLLLNDIEDTIRKISALRDLGLSFALDDFGTGYSSLSYLQRLPLQSLKIDQSFVRKLGAEADSEAIIRAIVQVGQSLNLTLVAEGVETERQWNCLARMACDQYQGYLFGRPVPLETFEQDVASVTPAVAQLPAPGQDIFESPHPMPGA